MELCPKEEMLLKKQLGVEDLTTEVEFWYGIFGELEDRLILKKKSVDFATQDFTQKATELLKEEELRANDLLLERFCSEDFKYSK